MTNGTALQVDRKRTPAFVKGALLHAQPTGRGVLAGLALLVVVGCGGDPTGPGNSVDSGPDAEAAEAFGAAFGAGQGGGTLTFNGTTYAIDSAVCMLQPPVEVGTVGDGYRVLIGGSVQRPDVSILGPDSVHWTAQNDLFTVAGSRITGASDTYCSNRDATVIEASFEIECP